MQINSYINKTFNYISNLASRTTRFLDTNKAWGACAVDVGCMVVPRTATDWGNRGAGAGIETAGRESAGTINHASIGPVYGTLAGMLVASTINSKYDINAKRVFADSNAVEVLGKINYDIIKANPSGSKETYINDYCKNIAENICNTKGENIQALSKEAQEQFANILKDEIQNPNKENIKKLKDILLYDFCDEANIGIKNGSGKVSIKSEADVILKNITSLSPEMFKDKVIESFRKAEDFLKVNFIKSIKNYGTKRALVGLGIASAIGCATQPINAYITKKRTGTDGFVGVEGREKDNSTGFKFMKAGAALAFVAFAFSTILNPKQFIKNPSEFLKKIQYKSLTPTLEQFKFVYGLTIASRFLAARDKDELRESSIKDTFGFTTWLILGNFVAKGTMKLIDKVLKTSLSGRTRDEILYEALKKAGISTTAKDGKILSYAELLNKADRVTKRNIRAFAVAQFAGYLFSALVLGFGIPKLNIAMTKRNEEKRKAKLQANNPMNTMLRPENIAFLNNNINFAANK